MKAYVITTGIIFGVLTVLHLLRMGVERHLITDPHFILLTLLSAVLCIWAFGVLRRARG